jgi:hypothetical protein
VAMELALNGAHVVVYDSDQVSLCLVIVFFLVLSCLVLVLCRLPFVLLPVSVVLVHLCRLLVMFVFVF